LKASDVVMLQIQKWLSHQKQLWKLIKRLIGKRTIRIKVWFC